MKPFIKSGIYAGFGVGTLVLGAPLVLAVLSRGRLDFTPGPWWPAGVVLFAAGFAVYFRCVADFAGPGRGTPAWWDAPRLLVVNPFFRVIRNPMYAGVGAMMAGVSLWLGSWLDVAWTAAVMLCFHVFVVRFEEPRLRRQFGTRYSAYVRRVPRWLPASPIRLLTSLFAWMTLKS